MQTGTEYDKVSFSFILEYTQSIASLVKFYLELIKNV